MFVRSLKLFAALFLALYLLPAAAGAQDYDQDIAAARELFLEAVDGGKREVRRALRHFRGMRDSYPGNPVVQAYLGACISLQARDAASGVNKQRFAEEALQQIDDALEAMPQDGESTLALETRLVAAHTLIHMPPFLNRLDQGEALVEGLLVDSHLDTMPPPFQAAVHLAAALAAKTRGEQEEYLHYLDRTAELDPEGRNGRRAAELLALEAN